MSTKVLIALLDDCRTTLTSMKDKNSEQEGIIQLLSSEIVSQNNKISQLLNIIDNFRHTYCDSETSANDMKTAKQPITTRSKARLNKAPITGETPNPISLALEDDPSLPSTSAGAGAAAAVLQPTTKERGLNPTYAEISRNAAKSNSANVSAPLLQRQSESRRSTYKKNSRPINKGTGIQDDNFMTVQKNLHIHAFMFHPQTTESQIIAFLSKKKPSREFTVEKLVARNERYASFKIGIPEDIFNFFLDPNIWPENIAFNEWTFRRGRNTPHTLVPPNADSKSVH